MMANDANDLDVRIFFPLDGASVGVSRVRIEGDAVASKSPITRLTYQINGKEEEPLPVDPSANLDFDIEIAGLGEGSSSIVIHAYDEEDNHSSAAIDLTYAPPGTEASDVYQNIEYDHEKLAKRSQFLGRKHAVTIPEKTIIQAVKWLDSRSDWDEKLVNISKRIWEKRTWPSLELSIRIPPTAKDFSRISKQVSDLKAELYGIFESCFVHLCRKRLITIFDEIEAQKALEAANASEEAQGSEEVQESEQVQESE